MSITNDPILIQNSKSSKMFSTQKSQMSTTNDPKMPQSLVAIMAKMRKRQAEAPAEDTTKVKKAYTGNLRVDVYGSIISVWNSDKSERFTIVVSSHGLDKMEKNERSNGFVEDGVIKIRPQNSEEYSQEIVPGEVFEVSRWHGGKPEKNPRAYKFGDNVVLKRVSMKVGENGSVFCNTHWVEHSEEQFQMTIPKTMTGLEQDSYHKAVVFGADSNVTNANFTELKLTSSDKIYSCLTFNYGEEGELEGSAMLWQEKLMEIGVYNPEVLEAILPKVLETSITIIGNKEKEQENYASDKLKMNIRALILGAGTLRQYVEEYGTSMTKAKVVKELGATVASDLNEGHPLNSQPDTTILNISEWSGSLANMPKSVKFYKMFDTITYAIIA